MIEQKMPTRLDINALRYRLVSGLAK